MGKHFQIGKYFPRKRFVLGRLEAFAVYRTTTAVMLLYDRCSRASFNR